MLLIGTGSRWRLSCSGGTASGEFADGGFVRAAGGDNIQTFTGAVSAIAVAGWSNAHLEVLLN